MDCGVCWSAGWDPAVRPMFESVDGVNSVPPWEMCARHSMARLWGRGHRLDGGGCVVMTLWTVGQAGGDVLGMSGTPGSGARTYGERGRGGMHRGVWPRGPSRSSRL